MIGFGWSEMLVIAIVLIVVVGPKDLPKMLRAFGRTTANIRRMAGDFQKQFDAALKEAELDDLQNLAKDARKFNPASELKKAVNPLERAARDVKSDLDDSWKSGKQAQADQSQKPASESARPATPVKPGPTGTAKPASTKPKAATPAKTGGAKQTAKGKVAAKAEASADKPKPTSPAKRVSTKPEPVAASKTKGAPTS